MTADTDLQALEKRAARLETMVREIYAIVVTEREALVDVYADENATIEDERARADVETIDRFLKDAHELIPALAEVTR